MKPNIQLTPEAKDKIERYPFPGNVRELQFSMERAVILCEGDEITADDLIFLALEKTNMEEDEVNLSSVEKNTILRVIEKNNGNISRAAKELGITRTALYRRINKYDID